jgi:glycosyltransferase involved in cell wall biosynthesis
MIVPVKRAMKVADAAPLRLLFVSTIMPYPPIYGSAIRTWSLLRALASQGVEITFLTFGSAGGRRELKPLHDLCRHVHVVPLAQKSLTRATDYVGRGIALLGRRAYAAVRYRHREMLAAVQEQLSTGSFDAIFADTLFALVNIPPVRIPLIANGHNVEYLILKRYLQYETNPVKRAYAWLESEKLRRWEQKVFRCADFGIACSEYDRDVLLAQGCNTPMAVLPNVVDTIYYAPQPGDGEPFTVMYQGGMDWFPNRDAVEYFTRKILPILRSRIREVQFVVAGRNPSLEFRRRFQNDPGVEFTGTVDDMRSLIQRAQVCVVPLRIGSGTRLKILESSAMGKPVVSTSLGAEGLRMRDGNEILLRDDPRAFADAVADLLLDPDRRKALGAAARVRVQEDYSFSALCKALRTPLEWLGTRPLGTAAQVRL